MTLRGPSSQSSIVCEAELIKSTDGITSNCVLALIRHGATAESARKSGRGKRGIHAGIIKHLPALGMNG